MKRFFFLVAFRFQRFDMNGESKRESVLREETVEKKNMITTCGFSVSVFRLKLAKIYRYGVSTVSTRQQNITMCLAVSGS